MSASLDDFLPRVITQDTHKRMQCHEELVLYLQDPHASMYCDDTDRFMDGLASWISSSNYKVLTL